MSKCLYCYAEMDPNIKGDYYPTCIKVFFGSLHVPVLPYRLSEMEILAKQVTEMSVTVPGVQPKLCLGWIKTELKNGYQRRLTIMNALDGNYILQLQNAKYPMIPENEHLSMKLAALFK